MLQSVGWSAANYFDLWDIHSGLLKVSHVSICMRTQTQDFHSMDPTCYSVQLHCACLIYMVTITM